MLTVKVPTSSSDREKENLCVRERERRGVRRKYRKHDRSRIKSTELYYILNDFLKRTNPWYR